MRKFIFPLWMSIILIPFSGCIKNEKGLFNFYLSHPKDPRLIGKWRSLIQPSTDRIYSEDGYIYHYSGADGVVGRGDCWYTEGDSIFRQYSYTGTYFKKSMEYLVQYYKIEEDYLCINDNLYFKTTPDYKRVKEQQN